MIKFKDLSIPLKFATIFSFIFAALAILDLIFIVLNLSISIG